ncbi:restriction endonuclease subunit S [Citrobacter cronae]|nr:restriction endonuclease subunit S [Citrobacter cronae]
MGSKWKQTTLGDLALGFDGAVDGPFGSNLPASAYTESGYPIIRGSNLTIGLDDFKDSDFVFVPEHIFQKLSRSECRAGDIIFTKKGTLGQTGLISARHRFEKYLLSSNQMRLRVDPEKALPEYVYYYVSSQKAINKLIQDSECTGVPKINLAYLKSFPISLPSLSEQKEIIYILGSLNRKIILNRQINQTLEQMSQTLFKSWFVDFDPVIDNALDAGNSIPEALQSRAKLRQKVRNSADFKPLPADIRALFPAEFEETELGWIPKNWHIRDFSDIAVLIKNNIKSDDICDDIHYIGLEHLERKHIFITSYGNGSDVSSNKSAFNKGDLLFGKLRPYFHKVAITPFSGICSTDILVFRAKEKFYKSLMAMYSFTDEFVAYANLRSTGTRMPRAEAKDLLKYKIILPNKNILEKFELLLADYWAKGQLNNNENDHLTALRDTLLPKLISGELSLEDLPDLVTQTEPA